MSWLKRKEGEDSFLKPKNARGGSFLRPTDAAARVTEEAVFRATVHQFDHQPEALTAHHEAEIVILKAQTQLTNTALAGDMDVATHNLVRLEQEKVKTEIEKAQGLSDIKVEEAKKMDDNRLKVYEQEALIDMQAAIGMHMLEVEKLDYLAVKILKLKQQNVEAERIEAMERVRVQMERRLLEKANGENVEGTDEDTQSSPDN